MGHTKWSIVTRHFSQCFLVTPQCGALMRMVTRGYMHQQPAPQLPRKTVPNASMSRGVNGRKASTGLFAFPSGSWLFDDLRGIRLPSYAVFFAVQLYLLGRSGLAVHVAIATAPLQNQPDEVLSRHR